jgi:ATP-dependent helicase/nuclease subunit B
MAMRRVGLAQLLLLHPGIGRSLGGSPRAALDLAGRWVEMFDGWEWLDLHAQGQASVSDGVADAPHLAADVGLLKSLQQASRLDTDRAAWMSRWGASHASEVWFCMNRSPSPKEKAMACLIWKVPAAAMRVFIHPMMDSMQPPPLPRQLIAAQTVEESAWAAVQTIMSWRSQGMDDIAVVALDRKMLRRLRALLERAGEPFADRSGWALDTTVAASALVGLNDLLTQQASTQSLLEWMHSPFVVRALAERFAFSHDDRRQVDASLRGYGRVAPLSLADVTGPGLLPFGELLATSGPAHAQRTVSQWSGQLIDAMQAIGLEDVLAQDVAGQAVLASIQMLHADALTDASQIASSLWHALLNESLAQSRFVEPVTDACVRVASLASLSWQSPKALLLLGADAQRLPQQSIPEFFEPRRFAEMGLINPPELTQAEGFGQFTSIWTGALPITCIACAEKPDAEAEFSNWIELLAMAEPERVDRVKASAIIDRYVMHAEPYASGSPVPTVFKGQLPDVISVTELQQLVDCPYRFYLQTLLGLSPLQPLQEESPPTDLGSLIHQVLADAKMHHASAHAWAEWLAARIDARLGQPFFARRAGTLSALAVPPAIAAKLRADAMALIPRLSEWLAERASRADPQAFKTLTEETVSRELQSLGITIKGRIDRWEQSGGRSTLIDFKTSDPENLKKNVKLGDRDVQLPMYAWLIGSEHSTHDAAYVSVRRDAVSEIGLTETARQPVADLAQAAVDQVTKALAGIAAGEPITLTGMTRDKNICERCNVRGICRRDDVAASGAAPVDESESPQ